MRILYIDTSSSYLYAGIVDDGSLVVSVKENYGQELSCVALPKIAEMFSNSNLEPNDIEKIIVVDGPGSFTGIRVGLTIAKVYAWSLKIPITTITSLEAMSASHNYNGFKVPIIDARRNYYYAAIYNSDDECLLKPQHIYKDKLLMELEKYNNYQFITNDEIDLTGEKCNYSPNIEFIVNKYVDKKDINPHMVNPKYLKLTEAEESKL